MIRRLAFLLCALPAAAAAQGTLTGQGFGYPAGQFGARASATAGALAPFDAVSPVNPAAVSAWVRGVIYFHVEPEYRTTEAAGISSSTRVSRFPLAGGATRVAKNGAIALTFSTYLDRSYETAFTTSESVGTDQVDLTTRNASTGAINDVRFATGWSLSPRLRVGAAYHAYTGENRLSVQWDFPDSLPYGDVTQTSTLAYSGSAVSGGVEWTAFRHLAVSAYGRLGGAARLRVGDTLVSRAHMPDHTGLSLRYTGIAGTVVAGGWERIGWSALQGLGTAAITPRDADRISVGAETRGPSVFGSPMYLRVGGAQRTLPFDAMSAEVKERFMSFGTGFTLARGRANVDLALQRASRTAGSAKERAWLFSFGLAISP